MRYTPEHGSRGKFLRGCRCDACKDAERDYHRDWRAGIRRGWPKVPLADRFWAKVDKSGECWVWTGALSAGYGQIHAGYPSKPRRSSRVSWELAYGPIPAGLFVCHHCDNRKCVRPDHLFLGDVLDNTRDMYRKGRDANGANRLNAEQVIEIRRRVAAGETQTGVGRAFGVSGAMVNMIVKRKRWARVP